MDSHRATARKLLEAKIQDGRRIVVGQTRIDRLDMGGYEVEGKTIPADEKSSRNGLSQKGRTIREGIVEHSRDQDIVKGLLNCVDGGIQTAKTCFGMALDRGIHNFGDEIDTRVVNLTKGLKKEGIEIADAAPKVEDPLSSQVPYLDELCEAKELAFLAPLSDLRTGPVSFEEVPIVSDEHLFGCLIHALTLA